MPGSVNVPLALWLKRGEKGNSLVRDFDSLDSHFKHSWSRMGTQTAPNGPTYSWPSSSKTSVFISLWSTAKGPEKKAISSQPWIEYLVSVTLPHTFGPAGLDTVLYVYKSMKGEIFQHAQCIPAPFCRRLGKALYRFQEMPHKHLQQIHDPLSEKFAHRPVASHSISMHFSLQKIPFYLTTLLASFACKSYGLIKQNHSKRTQLRRFGCCKISANCQIKSLFAFQDSLDV